MSIGISDEHVELAASLRKWAAGVGGLDAVRASEQDPDADFADVWAAVGEMGLATIGLPEAAGGGGGSVLDVAVALEACAHALVPGPLLGTTVAAALLGESEVARDLAAGAVVGLVLDGLVWDAPSATHLLLPDDAAEWFVVPRGAVELTTSVGPDLTRRFGTLTAVGDTVTGAERVPVPGLTTALVRRTAITLAAAEAAGIARWSLETAVDHAGVREQFGAKIGSFQAIKHLCAKMLETAESVTAAAWDVASVAFGDDDQWAWAADVAGTIALDGAVANAQACIQVLGGIGFTFEHDAHFYLRRATMLRSLLGPTDSFAAALVDLAESGVRRKVAVDLEGRDESVREEVRTVVAGIVAADDRRAALVETGYLTPH